MKILKKSSEEEMVYQFLKMEMNSERYAEKIESVLNEMKLSGDIIVSGDVESKKENGLRADILKRFRGYRDKEIFENFPSEIDWFWTTFGAEDISKIFYIVYDYWNELSNFTGSPLEAANTIRAGRTVFGVPNDNAVFGAGKIKKGHKFPPLIFLTDKSESRFLILEGHGRMTAYGLVPELFNDVSVLLGYCDAKELDKWYGKMPERG